MRLLISLTGRFSYFFTVESFQIFFIFDSTTVSLVNRFYILGSSGSSYLWISSTWGFLREDFYWLLLSFNYVCCWVGLLLFLLSTFLVEFLDFFLFSLFSSISICKNFDICFCYPLFLIGYIVTALSLGLNGDGGDWSLSRFSSIL